MPPKKERIIELLWIIVVTAITVVLAVLAKYYVVSIPPFALFCAGMALQFLILDIVMIKKFEERFK